MVLASFSRNTASMCHAAMLINETMPDVLVAQAKERNGSRGLCGVRVGLLGMAFKGDNDDTRDSLSFKCRRLLHNEGAKVLCTDEYVVAEDFVPLDEAAACPVVIIACPHTAYKGMRFSPDQIVVDCWNIAGDKIPLQVRPQTRTEPLDLATSPKKRILITGSHGFIMGYVIPILLENGHEVWGVDNFWKYGELAKEFDSNPNFHFVKGDAKDAALLQSIIETNKIQIFVAGAAIIGGIAMFHKLAYFLLSENERITCAAFDACVAAHEKGILEKIVVISSSMVYESSTIFPSSEDDLKKCPPPQSTYGFQKLACEYFAKGAWEQHGLPYTIIRPFNAVGIGEKRAAIEMEVLSGNVKLAMSHVVPDIVQKVLKGQNPLHILGSGLQKRHYTYAGDLAEGIVRCTLDPRAQNEDYNVSTPVGHTVLELSKVIWDMLNPDIPFAVTSDDPFEYDVQLRVPDVSKAERELGITCTTSLETTLEEVIPWIKEHIKRGEI
jgi:nucleoside-diphosphate-sugar epimerase